MKTTTKQNKKNGQTSTVSGHMMVDLHTRTCFTYFVAFCISLVRISSKIILLWAISGFFNIGFTIPITQSLGAISIFPT